MVPNIEKTAVSKNQTVLFRGVNISSQRKVNSSRWDNLHSTYVTPTRRFNVNFKFKRIPNVDKTAICKNKTDISL